MSDFFKDKPHIYSFILLHNAHLHCLYKFVQIVCTCLTEFL